MVSCRMHGKDNVDCFYFLSSEQLTTLSAHSNKCNCSCFSDLGVKLINVQ